MASTTEAASSTPEHQPYVPDDTTMPEFTWSAVLVGAVLGIIFGASSLYLVLKVGMTVSASIPVAVLSITLFRGLSKTFGFRRTTILENNIVQTTGSAGESIAFGVGVTMPALMILGFQMDVARVLVVSGLGGLLGILMMIPLRRAFIVKKHKELPYPEGTACADVLIVGEKGGSSAKTVFVGFGFAFIYQFLWQGLKLFKEIPEKSLRFFKGATPGIEVNPALLGVGYIIGTRISFVMAAGGVLATFVMIPTIRQFGETVTAPIAPGTVPIGEMSDGDIWSSYILYIGAGAVAAGGIISLFQALPLIISSIKSSFTDLRSSSGGNGEAKKRTDRDLPIWLVGVGSLGLVIAITLTPQLNMNLTGAILIVLFGFLFVTVSSRLTGEIGSSSNPISGMTVATLLITCLIFLSMDWTGQAYKLTALSVAAVVCIASSNGGTTSQDLKTGYLVGGTPKYQQYGILIGSFSSALVIGIILLVLNQAGTVYTSKTKYLPDPSKPIDVSKLEETQADPQGSGEMLHVLRVGGENEYQIPAGEYLVNAEGKINYLVDPGINGKVRERDDGTQTTKYNAPKASLMALITDGILSQKLPWSLVLIGVSIAIVLEFCGVPSLPFAVGVYLPIDASMPILCGGLVRYVVDRYNNRPREGHPDQKEELNEAETEMSPGVLMSTGFIAGGAIGGVLIAFLSFNDSIPKALGVWQYRTWTATQSGTVNELSTQLAREEAGANADERDLEDLQGNIQSLNSSLTLRYLSVPAGEVLNLPQNKRVTTTEQKYLQDLAAEHLGNADNSQLLINLNDALLAKKISIDEGQKVNVSKDKEFTATKDTTLYEIAQEQMEGEDRVVQILKLNSGLEPTSIIPQGAELRIPQKNWPSLLAFGILILVLVLVGCGWWLRDSSVKG